MNSPSNLTDFLAHPTLRLSFLSNPQPKISILLLTHNHAELLYRCLNSLLRCSSGNYEVIVIDNASTDETKLLLSRTENVRVISNRKNAEFIYANNSGAGVARGDHLLFLNNDTESTQGWLSLLLETIESHPRCGVVGAKLVYPNGRLQEAGGIVWNDGTTFSYGRGDDPSKPEYNYVREVDYCSAACLLVRRDLFEQLGGFDERYVPAYYEDVDLCFGIRSLGYKVMYQPQSVVVHHESMSRPAERRLQLVEANRAKFVEKWGEELKKRQPPLPGVKPVEIRARDVRRGRRVLLIAECDDDANKFSRIAQMVGDLTQSDCVITLALSAANSPQDRISKWQACGVEVLCPSWIDFAQILNGHSVLAERKDCYDTIIVHSRRDVSAIPASARKSNPRALALYEVPVFEDDKQAGWAGQFDGVIVGSEAQRADISRKYQIEHLRVWDEERKDSLAALITPEAWGADYFMRRAHAAEQKVEEYRAARDELEKIRHSKAWQLLGIYWEMRSRLRRLFKR
jgi:GT2 family glycosyltransferase